MTLPENVGHEPGEESRGVPSVRRDGSVRPPVRGALHWVSVVLSTPGAVGPEGQSDSNGDDDDAYDDDESESR